MRRVLVAFVAIVGIAATTAPSSAADLLILTYGGKYMPGDNCANIRPVQAVPCVAVGLTIPAGSTLTYRNADNDAHTVTSDAVDPTGRPLFDTAVLNYNQSGPVTGVAALAPGTYGFHCVIHSMTGKLTVV